MQLPTEVEITSHRSIIGKFIVAYKKLIGLLIAPYLRSVFEKEHQILDERIAELNNRFKDTEDRFHHDDKRMRHSELRLDDLEHGMRHVDTKVEERLDTATRDIVKRFDALLVDLGQRQEKLWHKQEGLGQNIWDISQDITLQKRRLDLILTELREKAELDNLSIKKIADQKEHLMDHSYFVFEKRHRGSSEEVKKNQEIYLPIFKDLRDRLKDKNSCVIDIGCGRGEFLEILKENNISARGVDLNEDMVHICREKGLQVEQADGTQYLKGLKDDSIAGVIACQFIEHLPVNVLIDFVKLCYDKLKKGRKVLFETINPESIFAMKWFYLDLSHQKPIPPQAISFLLESIGFYNIELKYLSPVTDDLKLNPSGDENIKKLNDFLFGYQDYAIIAEK